MRPLTSIALVVLALATVGPVAHAKSSPEAQAQRLSTQMLKPFVARLERATNKAASTLKSSRPELHASRMYLLEQELVDMLQYVNGRKELSKLQKGVISNDIRGHLGRIQHTYTTIQSTMRAKMVAANPGTDGTTLVERVGKGKNAFDIYWPSFHTKKMLPKAEQRRRYLKLKNDHQAKHPGEKPYIPLNAKNFKAIGSGELVEFVVTPGQHVRITRNAKHVVVGGGKPARGPGGLKVFWGKEGSKKVPLLAVVSNWSGTYQGDMASVFPTMVRRLTKLNVPSSRIILTASMPVSTKMYETLLQTRGVEKPLAKARGARLVAGAKRRLNTLIPTWNASISGNKNSRIQRFPRAMLRKAR